jgi:outer membrane beta-barrel protein
MLKVWILAVIAGITTTGYMAGAQAQQEKQAPAATDERGSDKLDLKRLEDKYWSAKDTDFSVVQNRRYTKANRFFVSLAYGPLVNDAYSYGRMTNVAGGYYFSERMGVELAYEVGAIKNSDSTDKFINVNHFAPDYNQFKSYTSINYIIVPFYAKMSFWDRKIMYFDMQFAFGVGQMSYKIRRVDGAAPPAVDGTDSSYDKTTLGYNIDVTQQLFFAQNFAVRFDIKNKWSKQKKERYYLQSGQDRDLGEITQQDTTMLLGLNIFF